MLSKKQYTQLGLATIVLIIFAVLGFWLASLIEDNPAWQAFIESYGIFGMLAVSIFAGLNPFVPVPPATFAPTFLAGGFSYLTIVFFYTIGTTIADSIGFYLGRLGKVVADSHYPQVAETIKKYVIERRAWFYVAVGCYITFAPLPNELILIPIAIAGYRYLPLLPVLLIGNAVHHSLLIYGYDSVFRLLFG